MKTAIIGAGLAGVSLARTLRNAGREVVLFDKGRGAGGRLSTRRIETPLGEIGFDHGAQYVTAQTSDFISFLDEAVSAGAGQAWQGRLVSLDRGGNAQPMREAKRYVGQAGMNAYIEFGLKDHAVHFGRRARKLTGETGRWVVHFEESGQEGPFDQIAITIPPEQLIELLARSDGDFASIIASALNVTIAPCWTVMAVCDSEFEPGFDGAKVYGGAIRWIARMAARPGFSAKEAIVLQASPDWSRAFLEHEPDYVARQLCEEAFVRFAMPVPVWSGAHRWRFSMVEIPAGSPCFLNSEANVGAAGDWCLGGKAEAAWVSGQTLAERLLSA